MNVPGFPGLGDEAALHSFANPDQVMMHRADREQHWNRNFIVLNTLIGEDHQPAPCVDSVLSFDGNSVHGRFETCGSVAL
jgi:hypothetical protein